MAQQSVLSIGFREFDSSDYDRVTEIYNANYPDQPLSIAELRYRDESLDRSKYLRRRHAVQDRASAETIWLTRISHGVAMFHPRKFLINMYVYPRLHNR